MSESIVIISDDDSVSPPVLDGMHESDDEVNREYFERDTLLAVRFSLLDGLKCQLQQDSSSDSDAAAAPPVRPQNNFHFQDALRCEVDVDLHEEMPSKTGVVETVSPASPLRPGPATLAQHQSSASVRMPEEVKAAVSPGHPQSSKGTEDLLSELSDLISGLTGKTVTSSRHSGLDDVQLTATVAQKGMTQAEKGTASSHNHHESHARHKIANSFHGDRSQRRSGHEYSQHKTSGKHSHLKGGDDSLRHKSSDDNSHRKSGDSYSRHKSSDKHSHRESKNHQSRYNSTDNRKDGEGHSSSNITDSQANHKRAESHSSRTRMEQPKSVTASSHDHHESHATHKIANSFHADHSRRRSGHEYSHHKTSGKHSHLKGRDDSLRHKSSDDNSHRKSSDSYSRHKSSDKHSHRESKNHQSRHNSTDNRKDGQRHSSSKTTDSQANHKRNESHSSRTSTDSHSSHTSSTGDGKLPHQLQKSTAHEVRAAPIGRRQHHRSSGDHSKSRTHQTSSQNSSSHRTSSENSSSHRTSSDNSKTHRTSSENTRTHRTSSENSSSHRTSSENSSSHRTSSENSSSHRTSKTSHSQCKSTSTKSSSSGSQSHAFRRPSSEKQVGVHESRQSHNSASVRKSPDPNIFEIVNSMSTTPDDDVTDLEDDVTKLSLVSNAKAEDESNNWSNVNTPKFDLKECQKKLGLKECRVFVKRLRSPQKYKTVMATPYTRAKHRELSDFLEGGNRKRKLKAKSLEWKDPSLFDAEYSDNDEDEEGGESRVAKLARFALPIAPPDEEEKQRILNEHLLPMDEAIRTLPPEDQEPEIASISSELDEEREDELPDLCDFDDDEEEPLPKLMRLTEPRAAPSHRMPQLLLPGQVAKDRRSSPLLKQVAVEERHFLDVIAGPSSDGVEAAEEEESLEKEEAEKQLQPGDEGFTFSFRNADKPFVRRRVRLVPLSSTFTPRQHPKSDTPETVPTFAAPLKTFTPTDVQYNQFGQPYRNCIRNFTRDAQDWLYSKSGRTPYMFHPLQQDSDDIREKKPRQSVIVVPITANQRNSIDAQLEEVSDDRETRDDDIDYLQHVLEAVEGFTRLQHEPPNDLIYIVLSEVLMKAHSVSTVYAAYNFLMKLLRMHPPKDSLAFEWSDVENAVSNLKLRLGIQHVTDRLTLLKNKLALHYMVESIEAEYLNRPLGSRRQVCRSKCYSLLSTELSSCKLRSIVQWLVSALTYGDYCTLSDSLSKLTLTLTSPRASPESYMEKDGHVQDGAVKEVAPTIKVYQVMEKLLDLSLAVSSERGCDDYATELSIEYNHLYSVARKAFLLENICNPHLRLMTVCKVLDRCDNDAFFGVRPVKSLDDIITKYFGATPPRIPETPPPTPEHENGSSEGSTDVSVSSCGVQGIEELAMLFYNCLASYLLIAKGRRRREALDSSDLATLGSLPETMAELEARFAEACPPEMLITPTTRRYIRAMTSLKDVT